MIAALALGALAGSSLLSAYGSLASGNAALDAAKLNSERYAWQGEQAKKMTRVNLFRQQKYAEGVRGSQRAAITHSGGSLDDPTSQEIFKDTDENAALDEFLIKYQGLMEQFGISQQGSNALQEGRMAKAAGQMGAVESLLSGASKFYIGYNSLYPGKARA